MVGRAVVLILFLFLSVGSFSQEYPAFYAGTDIYYHTSFSSNIYGNLNVGSQITKLGFFAPEIGYSVFYGGYPQKEIKEGDPNYGYPDALFSQSYNTSVLTLAPKLKFGKEDAFLVFIPKYHIGNIKKKASYFINEKDDGTFPLAKSQRIKEKTSYWTYALGFEGINISDNFWFGLTLNYSALNVRDATEEELNFSEYELNASWGNTQTIGFGIRFYMAPFNSEMD